MLCPLRAYPVFGSTSSGCLVCAKFWQGAGSRHTLTIRRAELADLEASLELDEILPRHQSQAPVYAPYWFGEYAPFADKEAIRQESIEILQDENAKFWLALRNGRIVGYQLYMPASPHFEKIDNLMVPEQCSYLAIAATREEEQGRGVGRALTAHGLAAAQSGGYTHCFTDWRVTNLLSSRFWPRQGFRPVAYRLSRRLDERIAWSHEKPSPSPWLPRTASVFPAKSASD